MPKGKAPASSASVVLATREVAVSATSSAFFKMGSWSSRARGRAVSLDIPPPATPPLQQDIACYMSNPLHRQPPLSPSTSSSVRSCQVTQGCLNNRMHPAGSNERNVQPQQLKPCLSRSLERNIIKRVSFEPLESTDVAGGSPGEWDAWARSSDYRPYSTRRSRDAPTCPEIPSFSSQDPPSPDSSARSCSARSRSSAGTYFFQGTLGRSRRCSSASDRAPRASERSEAGDGDATEAQSSCVEEEVSGSELEFYQFAKPFDPGVEDELQPYACSPPGDEGDTAIVDHAGCVVRRVKRGAGKRARRYGYMLEAEQIERCCATGGMAGRESWPVKLANAIVASNSPHFVE
ncbi:hypothetical protein DUNSADRAFT_8488 [Dunaliella salina]|uniref:Encoded protein n=1 Tax=Dunaliella salina TaxID=3046 RepID=A0ABQ7GJC6_DUNSA|nr:hypothetical protein DUNSADRAFT_8488 [Dunaliella salina]|eukprot:KAF5834718.1 hypothetical protein DUNSADRAFT_8488 [Dunaliella salina]